MDLSRSTEGLKTSAFGRVFARAEGREHMSLNAYHPA